MVAIIIFTLLTVSAVSANDNLALEDVNEDIASIDDNQIIIEENENTLDVGTFGDLESEISNISDGGTLSLIKDYKTTWTSSRGISISKSITIDGQGHTLDGNNISRIFYISANNVVLKNINFVNGNYKDGYGGAVYVNSNLNSTIINSNFVNCSALAGGAVFLGKNSNCSIVDSNFNNNVAEILGGSLITAGKCNVNLLRTSFTKGLAQYESGGAIMLLNSNLNAEYLEITDCYSEFGGAISSLSSSFNISHSKFINNGAHYDGGAIFAKYKSVSLYDTIFSDNYANRGAGVYISQTNNTLADNQFMNNNASNAGAIYIMSSTGKIMSGNIFKNNVGSPQADYYETINDNLTINSYDYYQFRYQDTNYAVLPAYYNLDDDGFLTPVKDQGLEGNCWAFSAMAALESCILKASDLSFDLSEANLKNLMAYYSDYGYMVAVNDGGHPEMAYGYLASWLGPINEQDDSYYIDDFLSPLLSSIFHVQNILFLKRNDYTDNDGIKNAILKYGAVSTSMYYSSSYLKNSVSYYYSGSHSTNHAVCIVGWDDNYSRDNFKNTPSGDGAWIVRNSWGPDWGDAGYFYVSYYDNMFAKVNKTESYTFIFNDTIKLDRVYQWEIQRTSSWNTYSDEAHYKNVFTVEGNEYLAAVSTYFLDKCDYKVSIYVNNILKTTKTGKTNEGYYTINLDSLIYLNENDIVEVIFDCTNLESSSGKIPCCSNSWSTNLFTKEGLSYYWKNNKWNDFYSNGVVACIKMFTAHSSENKLNPYFEIISEGDTSDNSYIISVILPNDATGSISIKINNKEHIIDLSKTNSIKLLGLDGNNNILSIKYSGDNKYQEKSLSVSINNSLLNDGSFEDLSKKISGAKKDSIITLTRDYCYVSGSTDGIDISKSITIDGQGHTISGNNLSRIFNVYAKNVILKNIVFIEGKHEGDGGAIQLFGSNCYILDCSFINNFAEYGGAVYCIAGDCILSNCSFINNSATSSGLSAGGGAVYWNGNNGVVDSCYFMNNYAKTSLWSSYGGAVYWSGNDGSLANCSFVNNYIDTSAFTSNGGAVYWSGNDGVLGTCLFVNNSAEDGSAVHCIADNCQLNNCSFIDNIASGYYSCGVVYWSGIDGVLGNCSFISNYAEDGGAVYWSGVGGVLGNCSFVNNSAEDGGAVYWIGTNGFLTNCLFKDNHAINGGAVFWQNDNGILNNCSFINNRGATSWWSTKGGGAIYWKGMNGIITNCVFSDNLIVKSGYYGGAIYWYGDSGEINNCSFINNYVSSSSNGGAIYWVGNNSKISNCYFLNNSAYNNGGAIHITGEQGSLTNCIFINNHVPSSYEGGAIYWVVNNGILDNCSFVNNSAYGGSAISLYGNNTNLNNCSFVNNSASGAGAAIYVKGSNCQLNNSYFANNDASILAGAIFLVSNDNIISNCSFTNNSAPNGGAIIVNGKNNLLRECTFENNFASELGGSLYIQKDECSLNNCSFINNVAETGGAIFWTGNDGLLENCLFVDNNASKNGSAVYWYGNRGILSNSTFIDNLNTNQVYWWNTESGTIVDCGFINNTNAVINKGANFIKRHVNLTSSNYVFDYKNPKIISVQLTNVLNNLPINSNITLYFDNGKDNKIFTLDLNNNEASLFNELFDLNAGNWIVNAIFEGDDNYYSSNTLFTVCITPIKSSIILELPIAIINQESTLIAKIGNDNNFTINEGLVTFYDGEIFIGNSTVKNNNANLKYTPNTDGEHMISAVYTSNNYLSSNCSAKLLVDSISVEVLVDSGVVGFNSTFVANVKGLYSTINEGTVSFYVDDNFVGKSSVVNGVSCLNYTPLSAGNFTVKAIYGESNDFSNVESSTNYIVNPADSQIIINEFYGTVLHEVVLSLTVVSSNNLVINDGTVTFMDNGNVIGSSDVNNGIASLSYLPTTDGEHIITTIYNSNNYLTSNGYAKLFVDSADVKIVVDNGIVGFESRFVANVMGLYSIVNEGNVTFYIGDVKIGKVNVINGSASLVYVPLISDEYAVKAVFSDSVNFLDDEDIVTYSVAKADSTLIINNFNGTVGHIVNLSASILSSNNLTINDGVVTFFDGSLEIGSSGMNNGVASLEYIPTVAGEHTITAIYNSNNYISSNNTSKLLVDSASVEIVVDNGIVGFNSTFVANVKGLYGIINEGTVAFYVNDNLIGKINVVNGVASLTYAPLLARNFTVKVVYGETDRFSNAESSASYIVNPADSRITINDVSGIVFNEITLYSNVVSSNNLVINDGIVTFTDNGNYIGGAKVVNGIASLSYTPTTAGKHLITAVYMGNDYLSSESSINYVVNQATSRIFVNYVSGTVFQEITLSSNVVSFNNLIIKDGNVTFVDNGNVIGVSEVVNGIASLSYTPTTAGEHIISTIYTGTNYLNSYNDLTVLIDKENTQIESSSVSTIYNGDKYLVATLKDAQDNPISGVTISLNLNGVKKLTTDANGQVKLTTNALVPKTYTAIITFEGDDNYVGSSATVNVKVTKATPKLTASAKTFKVSVKTKKYTVTLKDNKNKAMNKAKVTIKVNGKTFSTKTNSKGQATFKITNLNKKSTFKAVVTYAATSCYNKVTKSVKITVK